MGEREKAVKETIGLAALATLLATVPKLIYFGFGDDFSIGLAKFLVFVFVSMVGFTATIVAIKLVAKAIAMHYIRKNEIDGSAED